MGYSDRGAERASTVCGTKGCVGTDGFRRRQTFQLLFSPAEDVLCDAGSSSLCFVSHQRAGTQRRRQNELCSVTAVKSGTN